MGNSGSSQSSKPRKERKGQCGESSKKPKEHVTVIARSAGRLWAQMTPEQRKKYIDLANAEKKRREEQRRKRKSRRRYRESNKYK